MAIKIPFGADPNDEFFGGTSKPSTLSGDKRGTSQYVTINSVFTYVHHPSASHSSTLKLTIADSLPVGAILHVRKSVGTGALLLSTTYFERVGNMGLGIGSPTAAKGTGLWVVSFFYNGSKFQPMSIMNLNNLDIVRTD